MAILERVKTAVKGYRPEIGSGFLTYIDLPAAIPPPVDLDDRYSYKFVDSSTDPLLGRVAPRWQRRYVGQRMDAGDLIVLVIMHDDRVIGHFWLAFRTLPGLFNGVMNVELIEGEEAYGFDLYIDPEYRRGKIGNWVAWLIITTLCDRDVRYGYTHVLYDNVPSIFWHHGVGFNSLQTFNYFNFGPRIWWKMPFSETPRYGPLSRRGRYNDPEPPDPFGGSMLPQ
jgi:GNAT superfamily N-acetyltransferase